MLDDLRLSDTLVKDLALAGGGHALSGAQTESGTDALISYKQSHVHLTTRTRHCAKMRGTKIHHGPAYDKF